MTVRVRVIPCLDVRDGRVVKGVNFVDLKDAGDPVEQAQAYDAAGADELCFLDISASHEGRGTLLDMVRRTAEVCFMPLTVGGGVRSVEDARALLLVRQGGGQFCCGKRPELVREIAEKFGSQCIASVDARASTSGDIRGWKSTRMGGASRPGSTRSNTRSGWPSWRANCSSPRWRRRHQERLRCRLTRAIADAVSVPVIAAAGWARSISSKA